MDTPLLQVSYVVLWVLVVLHSVVLLGLVRLVSQQQQGAGAPTTNTLSTGAIAPSFSGEDVNGVAVTSQQFTGKPLLLLFVTATCRQCIDALNDMAYLKDKADGNVVVVCRSEKAECGRLASEYASGVPVVMDEDDRVSRAFGVFFVPTAVVISPENRILSHGEPDEVERIVRTELANEMSSPHVHQVQSEER